MGRIEPAVVTRADDGTPWSPRYGDVYHSADSGPGQARHVFLGGNGLPDRWRGRDAFVVLETGFGLGINFLATLDAWTRDPSRPRRLDYVAIERHPVPRDELASLLARHLEYRELASRLVDRWPDPLPGTHRRDFGGAVLTLVLDDVESALRKLDAEADAVYLDGFAPSRNPAMWTPAVLRGVARRMRPGATCTTWSTARAVRDALEIAGVETETRPGFGHKREMLVGRLVRPERRRNVEPARIDNGHERHALIVGAGLAGAATAAALAGRGWRTTVLDAAPAPAGGASSLHAGSFHPLVARDDSLLARLSRVAFLHALDAWRELERRGHAIAWDRCGVLQLERRADGPYTLGPAIAALEFPSSFARSVDAREGSELAGIRVERPGAWFPGGGWARAGSLVRAWIDEAAARGSGRFLGSSRVAKLEHAGGDWSAVDERGTTIASAPVVVLANASDLPRLAPLGAPLRRVRGQITRLPVGSILATRAVVIGNGYLLPEVDGRIVVGSSYDLESAETAALRDSDEGNLARLRALSPDYAGFATPDELDGEVGFRAVAIDRMPLAGAAPDGGDGAPRAGLYAVGAFASRGITWATLMGEIAASRIAGDPLPVESDLAAAVDPSRFLLRRRGPRS